MLADGTKPFSFLSKQNSFGNSLNDSLNRSSDEKYVTNCMPPKIIMKLLSSCFFLFLCTFSVNIVGDSKWRKKKSVKTDYDRFRRKKCGFQRKQKLFTLSASDNIIETCCFFFFICCFCKSFIACTRTHTKCSHHFLAPSLSHCQFFIIYFIGLIDVQNGEFLVLVVCFVCILVVVVCGEKMFSDIRSTTYFIGLLGSKSML